MLAVRICAGFSYRFLGEVVSDTKEKLKTLKTAAERANTVPANGKVSQKQYDARQKEIIEMGNTRPYVWLSGRGEKRLFSLLLYFSYFIISSFTL